MNQRTKGTRRHVLISFVACLALAFSMLPTGALAVTSQEKQAEADALVEQLNGLQDEINAATQQYNDALSAYDAATAAMEEAQKRIIAAEERIDAAQEKLSDRAVAIYRHGQVNMLDVLMGANSFTEFVTLSAMVNQINESDAELIEESKSARAEAQAARNEYESQKNVAAEQMQAANDAKASLEAKASEMQSEIDKINEEVAELQAAEEAAAEEAERLRQLQQQQSSSSSYSQGESVVVGSGILANPCPGYSYISSTFGYRTYDYSFHKGLDMAASQGTPIYAAAAGTVLIAGYSSSAGNWVVIAHGNGLVTKYMHMATTPFVSAGQTVEQGTNIGVVGSTGNSSGPHLHFQVEVNGTAVDPQLYL